MIIEKSIIKVAVESKWIGKSTISVADVMWDIIRLELISNQTGAKCYFVLAGSKKKLLNFFQQDRFLEKSSKGQIRPVLRIFKGVRQASLRLASPIPSRAAIIKSRMKQYPDVLMPAVVGSGYPEIYPQKCKNSDYQVYVWEIFRVNNDRFKPRNNCNYQ